jgi:hypothetical protein
VEVEVRLPARHTVTWRRSRPKGMTARLASSGSRHKLLSEVGEATDNRSMRSADGDSPRRATAASAWRSSSTMATTTHSPAVRARRWRRRISNRTSSGVLRTRAVDPSCIPACAAGGRRRVEEDARPGHQVEMGFRHVGPVQEEGDR